MRRAALALLAAALLAVTAVATPAHAATYVRPVTLTVTSNACVYARWTVTLVVTSTKDRVVDVWQDGDGGTHPIWDLDDVRQVGVQLWAGVPRRIVTHPGESARLYTQISVLPAGAIWDTVDPLATKTIRPPAYPYATC